MVKNRSDSSFLALQAHRKCVKDMIETDKCRRLRACPPLQGAFNAKALLDLYNTDPSVKHLKPYTPIIYDSEVNPIRSKPRAPPEAHLSRCSGGRGAVVVAWRP